VGEVGNRNWCASPGNSETCRPAGGVPATAVPSWGYPAFRSDHDLRSCYSVHSTPPRRFYGHAVFRRSPPGTEAPGAPVGLGSPSGRYRQTPAGVLRGSSVPHEVRRPYNDISPRGPHPPGFQPRFVPPSGFLTLLTVCSPSHLPISEIGAAHGVHPSEPFPPAEPYAFRRRCPLAVSDITSYCSEDQ
jgi:hypothetical protein